MYSGKTDLLRKLERKKKMGLTGCFSAARLTFKESKRRWSSDIKVLKKRKQGVLNFIWDARIKSALKNRGVGYAEFVAGLLIAQIHIERRMVAYLALCDGKAFDALCSFSIILQTDLENGHRSRSAS